MLKNYIIETPIFNIIFINEDGTETQTQVNEFTLRNLVYESSKQNKNLGFCLVHDSNTGTYESKPLLWFSDFPDVVDTNRNTDSMSLSTNQKFNYLKLKNKKS